MSAGENFAFSYTVDTIQDFCGKFGINMCINWITRDILSENFIFLRSTNIIKDQFLSYCWNFSNPAP